MSKLYACITNAEQSGRLRSDEAADESVPPAVAGGAFSGLAGVHSNASTTPSATAGGTDLVDLARQFSHRVETIENGVLFDVSGMHNRIGSPAQIAGRIAQKLAAKNIDANVAVAANAQTAVLYARSRPGVTVVEDKIHQRLPLESLGIDQDTLNVFHALGLEDSADLKKVPEAELLARYGPEFRQVIDLINQNGVHVLTPNLKENHVSWSYDLDFPVDNFERLIFILGHGLGKILEETAYFGFSSEQIDIALKLDDKTTAEYSIKLSFPTMDKAFWMKLINLRIGNDPPPCEIVSIKLACHFARQRAIARGLFSATRPEPESLLLTIDKIKNIVGAANVGVPVLVDQRLPEAFQLDAEKLPAGKEQKERSEPRPVLALTYFHPPLVADVSIFKGRLMYLRTQHFAGKVTEYGGTWKESSQWWTRRLWERMEWDVELEDRRLYRLMMNNSDWFVTGIYD